MQPMMKCLNKQRTVKIHVTIQRVVSRVVTMMGLNGYKFIMIRSKGE